MKATSIIPCLGYNEALNAIDWLCNAFGFEKHQVFAEENGVVSHAELVLGNCMIMVGTQDSGSPYSRLIKHPSAVGSFETQSPYIVLDESEVDALYEKAKKHGARMAIELKQESYGGKNFSCYDLEGHLWNFGSYDPWQIEKQ
ncbi:MAG: hypothetical protein RIB71_03090 [Imperialibacter sp.]|uniref:VOC family protein n=1 Tax=Imperialibacter sp. TaxID=2038411 RepID=UPI0032ECA8A6